MRKRQASKRPPRAGRQAGDPIAGLASSIAHDFSNLLMVIRHAGAFLKEDLPPDDPRQEQVGLLLSAANRAVRLTQQLQAMGRSQLLRLELVRPAEIVRGVAGSLRDLVPEDVEFRTSIRATRATVRFDVAQLHVVLMNLVSYVAERAHSHARLMLVIAEEKIGKDAAERLGAEPGMFVSIRVVCPGQTNTETGVADVFAPRLAGKKLPRGTDLRLASVHGVVTQSGGFVSAGDRDSRDVELAVFLPLATGDEAVETDAEQRARFRVYKDVTGTEVILLVEDDAEVRATLREGLERYGYTVLEASDGEEAERLVDLFNDQPDLILTDLVMPRVTGRELIERLRMGGRLPKILMMSGYTDDDVLRRATPHMPYPFIRKPFTHDELAAKIRETLDG